MNATPTDPTSSRWLQVAGAVLIAIAVSAGLGRLAGIDPLLTWVSGGAPMALWTVLGFLLGSGAFFAFARGAVRIGRGLALGVAALGLGTVALYAAAELFDFGEFYVDHRVGVRSTMGRMAPNTAGSFALLGLALWWLGARPLRNLRTLFCVSMLLAIAIVALVGYATGLRSTVVWWRYTAMPLHTAAAFLTAAAAVLAWVFHSARGAQRATARMLPFFAAAGTTLGVLIAVMLVANEHRRETVRSMMRTMQLAVGMERMTTALARMETMTRNYSLSGVEQMAARAAGARNQTLTTLATLERTVRDDAEASELVRGMRPLVAERIALSEEEVAARRQGGLSRALQVVTRQSAGSAPAFRSSLEGLRGEITERVAQLREEAARGERVATIVLVTGMGLMVGFIVSAFVLVERTQVRLERANDELEQRVRDRTAALQASTAQLRESEGRLRFLADTMPQLVWTARPDGTIETVNRGYIDYLGTATEAEAIEKVMTDVLHPDDLTAAQAEWSAMLADGRPGSGELRLRRSDGVYQWHLWRAHPERDVDGRIVRWIGTSTNIHDHKLAEERLEQRVAERTMELAATEERFRNAFHYAGIGMALIGLDGRWLRVNRAICEIVGYSEAELLEKTFQDITHPDDLEADLANVRDLIAGNRRFYQMEKRYFHRDSHVVWVRLTVSLVRNLEGAPVHFVSQIEDITERKRLEENFAAARDQALEASRLKSEFLATMSHEIRTPMNGVIGMTALLRDTALTEVQAEYVRTIESSGESLLTIINDILDYSKIEAGRIELEVTSFDLRQCVEDSLDLFASRAMEKKIELVYIMGPAVPARVEGDATRLRQVLVNLIGNAIKFTESGEVVVTIDAQPIEQRYRLSFSVKDTGIGIPGEGMERLFKSFSQVDASTTRRYGGTGLGLAISKRLVELMEGEMWAESTPGEGSTFHFTVLLNASAHFVQHRLHTRQPDVVGRRLLVVDDNDTNRRVVIGLATAWGMIVREAAGSREALSLLSHDPQCDVAVLDMHMPEIDGEQLAMAIRTLPGGEKIPLILLTSLGRRSRSGEFAQLLSKPVKPDALFTAIRACLQPERAFAKGTAVAAPQPDANLARRCPLRLLVAEDNGVNQKVAVLLLQRLGYRATVVANGLEALTAVRMADYDAILMDVEMPELDGCEATRRIRREGKSPTRPWIIALTAGAMQGDRERALASGMNDFLAKPVRTEALSEALARAHERVNNAALRDTA